MSVPPPYRVHVILEATFGERLAMLPADEPVWVVRSAVNGAVAHRLRQEQTARTHLDGITTFSSHEGASEEAFLVVLDSVDLHHGEHSAAPPYSRLEVVGCPPSELIRSTLAQLGFRIVTASAEGFTAERSTHFS